MSQTPLPFAPRLLNAGDTAKYLGFKSRDVLKNFPIKPIRICPEGVGSKEMWDRNAIDRHLDAISGLKNRPTQEESEYILSAEEKLLQWEAMNGRRAA